MKALKLCPPLLLLLLFAFSCSNSEPEKVLRGDGAFRAYIAEVDSQVIGINKNLSKMERIELDSVGDNQISTEYPYWKRMHVYLDKEGIRKAALYADYEKGKRTEELYFRGGELIHADINKNGLLSADTKGQKFYFAREKLIFALDGEGNRLNVKTDSVKVASIDLVREATQFRALIAKKDL